MILWRRDASHIKYEWVPSGLDASMDGAQWNDTKSHLEATIQRLLQSSAALSCEAIVKVVTSFESLPKIHFHLSLDRTLTLAKNRLQLIMPML